MAHFNVLNVATKEIFRTGYDIEMSFEMPWLLNKL